MRETERERDREREREREIERERSATPDKVGCYSDGYNVLGRGRCLMTHKYRGSIVVLSISKSVEPNEEQKEMTSSFSKVFSASTEIISNRQFCDKIIHNG